LVGVAPFSVQSGLLRSNSSSPADAGSTQNSSDTEKTKKPGMGIRSDCPHQKTALKNEGHEYHLGRSRTGGKKWHAKQSEQVTITLSTSRKGQQKEKLSTREIELDNMKA